MSESAYKRIDHAVYRAERALVVASLIVMSVVVFLDVVHRSFSGEDSKFAMVMAKLAGWMGTEIAEGSAQYQQLADASPYVLLVVFTLLGYFGIRSAKRATPIAPPIAFGAAVAGVMVVYGLVRLLLVVVPNGLIWSQPLALVLTLWVGFIGASMCTYESRHLRVEAVQRFLPEKWKPVVGFASGIATTAVCLALLWLSIRYVRFNYEEYVATEGKGGLFLGMDMPKYLGFSALPIAFAFMAVRFAVKGFAALRGEFDEPPDLVEAAGGAVPDEDGRMPSEVATEALPAPDIMLDDDKQSAIETMTSKARMAVRAGVPKPQSRVPTDAHVVLPPAAGALPVEDDDDDDGDAEDVRETREVEEGPIPFVDETRDLASDDVPDDGKEADR